MMNPDPAQRIEPMRIRSIERICEFLDIVYAELSTLNRVEATNTRFGDPRFRSWFQELERRVPGRVQRNGPFCLSKIAQISSMTLHHPGARYEEQTKESKLLILRTCACRRTERSCAYTCVTGRYADAAHRRTRVNSL